jgi:uncharacterized protein YrrD
MARAVPPLSTEANREIFMSKKLTTLQDGKVIGPDGPIGQVKDLYFDDVTWKIRYVAVDTAAWLPGRRVLLPPSAFEGRAFGKLDEASGALRVNLLRRQVEAGPLSDPHARITPEFSAECDRHYGAAAGDASRGGIPARPNGSLRSAQAIIGFEIHATDGAIGSLIDLMVHERTWVIRELVVETGHWFNRKTVFLLPEDVLQISAETSSVRVNLTREVIQQTTSNDVAQTGVGHL